MITPKSLKYYFKGAVCAASGYFLIRNSDEYSKAKTVTSIDSTTASLSDIIFPSIFICNVNQGLLFLFIYLGLRLKRIFVNKKRLNESRTRKKE